MVYKNIILILLLFLPYSIFSQTQIGNTIYDDIGSIADNFGTSVSSSANGNIIAVGASINSDNGYHSGHTRIFENIGGIWTQVGNAIEGEAAGDTSGSNVSLSSDGNIVAIGAGGNDGNGEESGHVRIFENISGVWTQIGNDIDGEATGDRLGGSISLSSDGNIVAIGSSSNDGNGVDSGHVRVYENIGGVWTQVGNDIEGEALGDGFGSRISLSSNGSIVVIASMFNNGNGEESGHVRVYEDIGGVWTQVGADIDGEEAFDRSGSGISLSSDGTIVTIGALYNDGNGENSGHVRVYENISGNWIQVGEDINGNTGLITNSFGDNVILSSNGNVIAVSAPSNDNNGVDSGHVRIYENSAGVWTQIGDDIEGVASGDASGSSISLSSDGSIVAISAPGNDSNEEGSGHVRVFKNISGVWTQIGDDIYGEVQMDLSGNSVSLSSNGNIVAIGARRNSNSNFASGHVRVYENKGGIWNQIGNDIDGEAPLDFSGESISLSSDGSVVAIGASRNDGNGRNSGHVRIYENKGGVWIQIGSDIDGKESGDYLGRSVSLSSDGSIVATGASAHSTKLGRVYIYENKGGVWTQIGDDIEGEELGDGSGASVSLSSDGSVVAIGTPGNNKGGQDSGHVRIYKNINDVWTQVGIDINGKEKDYLGWSVSLSLDGSVVAIGAPGNGINGFNSGHVRIYDLSAVLSTQSFEKDYFLYYPNPVNDVLNIQLNKGLKLKQVNIYNLQSQYLYSVKTSKIDVSKLSSGMYFIEVETNQGNSAKKIIID